MGFVRHRQSQRAWDDVAPAAYDDPSLEGVERHDLIGALDEVPNYHVRYFHVEPGKQTRARAASPRPRRGHPDTAARG